MHTDDVMKYGHLTVLRTLDGLDHEHWDTPDVCGVWSVRQIIAHLASFEHVLIAILESLLGGSPTTLLLDSFKSDQLQFNDVQVAERDHMTPQQVFDEYHQAQRKTMLLMAQIPEEVRHKTGVLPWYGAEYDLEDFLVYSFYGHKREHCAQINVFRDKLKDGAGGFG